MNFLGFEPLPTFPYEDYLSLTEKAANEKISLENALLAEKAAAIKIHFFLSTRGLRCQPQ
jgi:hypothetical protein